MQLWTQADFDEAYRQAGVDEEIAYEYYTSGRAALDAECEEADGEWQLVGADTGDRY